MRKSKILLVLICLLFPLSSCTYDEKSIIVENKITKRITLKENSRYTLKKIKEEKYFDFFNKKGELAKREINNGHKFFTFEYDSNGNKVLMKTIRNDGFEYGTHYYKYDTKNNLIANGIGVHPSNRYKIVYSDDKLAAVFIYNYKDKLKEVKVSKYDWKGHLKEEYQVKNDSHSKLNKILYNYDFNGKIKEKKIYQARLKSKPYITEKSIKIFNQNYPPEFYKLKHILKYVYNDLNLVSEEIKLSPIGYELEKTFYEYFN